MSRNLLIKRCIYGQMISLCLATYQFCTGFFGKEFWIFYNYAPFFLLLSLINIAFFFIEKEKIDQKPPLLQISICAFCEVIIMFLFQKAMQDAKPYLCSFVNQLAYPMAVFYKVVILKKKENITVLRFFLFLSIILICFIISFIKDPTGIKDFKKSILPILYVLLANVSIICSINLQFKIFERFPPRAYNIIMSLMAIPILLICSLIFEYKNLQYAAQPLKVLTMNKIAYPLFLVVVLTVYCVGPLYIKRYHPLSFQSSLLSTSSFISLFVLIKEKEFKIPLILLYIICIASATILTYTNKES